MRARYRFGWLPALALLFVWFALPSHAETRVALVIGNSEYSGGTWPALPVAANDARDFADILKNHLGFRVFAPEGKRSDNLNREDFLRTLSAFKKEADSADWVLIYYGGHGTKIGDTNYLVPIGAQISPGDAPRQGIQLDELLRATGTGANKLKLVILDACRDPFPTRSSNSSSLGDPGVGSGTLVIYSAQLGRPAYDVGVKNNGRNSPFMEAMLEHIKTPNLPIRSLVDKVAADVRRSTAGRPRGVQDPTQFGGLPPNRSMTAFVMKDGQQLGGPVLQQSVDLEDGRYQGDLRDGSREGRGKMIWKNGDIYEGDWVGNKRDGRGKMSYAAGASYDDQWGSYDGQWRNDKRDGFGTMIFRSRAQYTGSWKDGQRSGPGVMTSSDGNIYDGLWKNDRRNGRGTYKWRDGAQYEGDWQDNSRTGNGIYIFPDRSRYVGTFKDEQFNGQGRFEYPNGDLLEGQFVNGEIRRGTFRGKNGGTYTGEFRNGQPYPRP